ncbi:MAG TPA: flippase activity-associated protein Agl23 [Chthoniobacteraceae bacterium]|jgi:uncharacterized protein (TIGR03663 family)|nr:flippase activity-associated protein Agl23 [Chthoniobacteraceae bacterium]
MSLSTTLSNSAVRSCAKYRPEVVIVVVALLLRLVLLELKPPHFDEGVNGFFVDQMTREGPYHYDPTNFHGPLHFYFLFLMQTLFGRHVWALRLPTVLFSTLCVVVALCYRRYLGRTTCRLAACGIALSPAMTFYGRYAIHESFLLLVLMIAVWGLIGLWRDGTRTALWATALGIAGMILTKETYAIHLTALALAAPTLLGLEWLSPAADEPRRPPQWTGRDWEIAIAVSLGAIVFFYSGALMSWGDLPGLWTTFKTWVQTGTEKGGGHAKDGYYWITLLARYEWAAFFGMVLSPLLVVERSLRSLRFLVIAGLGTLVAYTIIRYKTPWCIIVLIWPFFFVFGAVVERLMALARTPQPEGGGAGAPPREKLPVWLPVGLAALLLGHSAFWSVGLNFFWYDDETEPYVYVQTKRDVNQLMDPLGKMVALDRSNYQLKGVILLETEGDNHPLPWLLGDFTGVETLHEASPARETMDADFLFIQNPFVGDVEDRLRHPYFREKMTLRGSSELTGELYFDARKFAPVFPGRAPEFQPAAPAPPAETPVPAPEPP